MSESIHGNSPQSHIQIPELFDKLLLLNGYRIEDAEDHLAGDDGENKKWLNDNLPSTLETVKRAIVGWQNDWNSGARRKTWAVRECSTMKLVGGCELRLKDDGIAHLSYWVFPQYRGRGYAARALRLVTEYAFRSCGVERAELYIDQENIGSLRVAEKAGFIKEGLLRKQGKLGNERRDMVLFSKLSSDSDMV